MHGHKLLSLLTMLVLVAACSNSPTDPAALDGDVMLGVANSGPVVASATGSGHSRCAVVPVEPPGFSFNCDPTNPEGELRTLSFNARMYADGSVEGRAQMKNRENGAEGKGNVICLRFSRPNLAWIILDLPHVFGTPVSAMAVEDNGQGSAADPDRMTVFFAPSPPQAALVCDGSPGGDAFLNFLFDNPANSYDIAHGNVQVQAPNGD